MSTSISTGDSVERDPSAARPAHGARAPLGGVLLALLAKDLRLLRGAILFIAGACGAMALVLALLPIFGQGALEYCGFTQQSTLSDRFRVLGPMTRVMAALFPLAVGPILVLGDRTRGASVYSALLPVPSSLRWFSKFVVACAVAGAFVGVGAILQRAESPQWFSPVGVRMTTVASVLPVAVLALIAGFAGATIARGIPSAVIVGAFLLVAAVAGVGGLTSLLSPPIAQAILSARLMDPAWLEHFEAFKSTSLLVEADPVLTVVVNCSSSFAEAVLAGVALAAVVARRRQMLGETGDNMRAAPSTLVFTGIAILVAGVLASAIFTVRTIQWTSMWKRPYDVMVKVYSDASELPLNDFVASFLPGARATTQAEPCEDYLRRIAGWSRSGLDSWDLTILLEEEGTVPQSVPGEDPGYIDDIDVVQSYRSAARGRALRERIAQDPAAFEAAVRRVAEAGPDVPLARRARAAGMLGNLHRAALAAEELATAKDACGRMRAILVLSDTSPVRGRRPMEFQSDGMAREVGARFEKVGVPPFEISPIVDLDLVSEARARAVVALVMLDAAIARGDAAELASAFGGAAPSILRERIREARRIAEEPIPELQAVVGTRGTNGVLDLTDLGERPVRWSGMRASDIFVRETTDPVYLTVP